VKKSVTWIKARINFLSFYRWQLISSCFNFLCVGIKGCYWFVFKSILCTKFWGKIMRTNNHVWIYVNERTYLCFLKSRRENSFFCFLKSFYSDFHTISCQISLSPFSRFSLTTSVWLQLIQA
jgi:hypothetical protein